MLALALAILQQSPTDLSADFEVPEGLEVTLWAETPQLYNPTLLWIAMGEFVQRLIEQQELAIARLRRPDLIVQRHS